MCDVRVAGQVVFQRLAVEVIGVRVRDEHVTHAAEVQAEPELHRVQVGGQVDEHAVVYDRTRAVADVPAPAARGLQARGALAEDGGPALRGGGSEVLQFHGATSLFV